MQKDAKNHVWRTKGEDFCAMQNINWSTQGRKDKDGADNMIINVFVFLNQNCIFWELLLVWYVLYKTHEIESNDYKAQDTDIIFIKI